MIFSKKKYIALILCLLLLILGFLLMSGPENNQPDYFEKEIYSFTRISLSPILILGAYTCIVILILRHTAIKCSEEK